MTFERTTSFPAFLNDIIRQPIVLHIRLIISHADCSCGQRELLQLFQLFEPLHPQRDRLARMTRHTSRAISNSAVNSKLLQPAEFQHRFRGRKVSRKADDECDIANILSLRLRHGVEEQTQGAFMAESESVARKWQRSRFLIDLPTCLEQTQIVRVDVCEACEQVRTSVAVMVLRISEVLLFGLIMADTMGFRAVRGRKWADVVAEVWRRWCDGSPAVASVDPFGSSGAVDVEGLAA